MVKLKTKVIKVLAYDVFELESCSFDVLLLLPGDIPKNDDNDDDDVKDEKQLKIS